MPIKNKTRQSGNLTDGFRKDLQSRLLALRRQLRDKSEWRRLRQRRRRTFSRRLWRSFLRNVFVVGDILRIGNVFRVDIRLPAREIPVRSQQIAAAWTVRSNLSNRERGVAMNGRRPTHHDVAASRRWKIDRGATLSSIINRGANSF